MTRIYFFWSPVIVLLIAVFITISFLQESEGQSTITENQTIEPENTTYTSSSVNACKQINSTHKKCVLDSYVGERFHQNPTGKWVNASDVLKITRNSDDLTFHYDGIKGNYSVTFETGIIYNGNYFSMMQARQLTGIGFDFIIDKEIARWKYGVNITNITINKSKIQAVTLTYKSHTGFTLADLKTEQGRFTAKNSLFLLFDDIRENGFTDRVNIIERRIYIENITLDKFVGNSLYLDPTLDLQVGANGDDGLVITVTENFVNTIVSFGSDDSGPGRLRHSWVRFLNVTITPPVTVDVSYLTFTGKGGETTAVELLIDGNDVDDAIAPTTYAGYNNLVRTTASVQWDFSTTWTNNVEFNTPSINAVVQEIVDRAGFASGSDMQFFVRGDLVADAIKFRMPYDYNDATAKAPKLHIEYTASGDVTPPTWSGNTTNSTVAGTPINHTVVLTDNTALDWYVFEFDNGTGTLSNDSAVDISGTSYRANTTKITNSTVSSTIQWRYYFNDTVNNWNKTNLFDYLTTSSDTCTYSSGNWAVTCSDNCTITTNTNLNNDNLIFTGSGTFITNANITNVGSLQLSQGCSIVINPRNALILRGS